MLFDCLFPRSKWYAYPAHHLLIPMFYNLWVTWNNCQDVIQLLESDHPDYLVLKHFCLLCQTFVPLIPDYGQAIR